VIDFAANRIIDDDRPNHLHGNNPGDLNILFAAAIGGRRHRLALIGPALSERA
jgi:hypothetical protein